MAKPVTLGNLNELLSSGARPSSTDSAPATTTATSAAHAAPITSQPIIPARGFSDVDSSSEDEGTIRQVARRLPSFQDGETMARLFSGTAATAPEVPLHDDDDQAVAALTAKYSALSRRDAVNQAAFHADIKAAMPEMLANIHKCFAEAKAKLAGGVPDAVIREEVTRQIWSHKMLEVHNSIGRAAAADPPEHYREARASALFTAAHAEELRERGYTLVEDCFTGDDLAALQEEMRQLQQTGRLKATVQKELGTRDDHIGWLSEAEVVGPAMRRAVLLQKAMALPLQTALGLPLRVPSRVMCSCYPGDGARYVPHRDNSTVAEQASPSRNANNLRELTCILYMNPHDWHAQRDGGCLRLHLAAGPSGTKETGCAHDCTGVGCHRDVVPKAGLMVLFKSREVLHEVMPAHRTRLAMTLWLFGEPVGSPP